MTYAFTFFPSVLQLSLLLLANGAQCIQADGVGGACWGDGGVGAGAGMVVAGLLMGLPMALLLFVTIMMGFYSEPSD
jgi:hypothetical protein